MNAKAVTRPTDADVVADEPVDAPEATEPEPTAPASVSTRADRVRAIQRALRVVTVDGTIGPETVRAFQRFHQFRVTGIVDEATGTALERAIADGEL